jgi:hypothetical protein
MDWGRLLLWAAGLPGWTFPIVAVVRPGPFLLEAGRAIRAAAQPRLIDVIHPLGFNDIAFAWIMIRFPFLAFLPRGDLSGSGRSAREREAGIRFCISSARLGNRDADDNQSSADSGTDSNFVDSLSPLIGVAGREGRSEGGGSAPVVINR